MAHKKSLLTKYLSGTESSDCRSPRHDGKTGLSQKPVFLALLSQKTEIP